jgi:hypothetical protein
MKSILKPLIVSALLLSLPLVTGCGKENPMAPEEITPPPPPAPEYMDVTVTLVRVLAVADGDGIEGAGDFNYRADVYDGSTLVVSGYTELETGYALELNRSRVIRIPKNADYRINVKFTGTEWDRDILGNTYADTRMNNLVEERLHSNGGGSAGFNDGERWITLGEGDLQLRLVYTITTKPVV